MDTGHRQQVLARLKEMRVGTLMETLDIRYTDVGEDWLTATMPVGPRVHQPMGILHGGATAALAESVGSAASALRLDLEREVGVGLELSMNHLRSVREGMLTARAVLIHGGRSTHLWNIGVTDEYGRQIAWGRLIVMVRPRAN